MFALLGVTAFSCTSDDQIQYEQYVIYGGDLYIQHCSNCHGVNGEGLRDLYPPLKGSDYLANRVKVICAIQNGLKGEIIVNGKKYNQVMPKNNQLYSLDHAQIATYIFDKWGDGTTKKLVTVEEVEKANCDY